MSPRSVVQKYSKSSAFYLDAKQNYFSENASLLQNALDINLLYKGQPSRTNCKLCLALLSTIDDFSSHSIPYVFCDDCGHLNGRFQDSKEFFNKLYFQANNIEYNTAAYVDESFYSRVLEVYSPKVEFLKENIEARDFSVLDIGCGAGHFVAACIASGIDASGIDVSRSSVEFGNRNLLHQYGNSYLKLVDTSTYIEEILNTNSSVISAIGVIEHIQDLPILFDSIRRSKAKYVYYSVPMASLSVVLENAFSGVFPRQLSADHTHLFTEKSLLKLNQLMNLKPIAQWRFGTDVTDLLRSLTVLAQASHMTDKAQNFFFENLKASSDQLQAVLDNNHFCSEIHVLAEKQVT